MTSAGGTPAVGVPREDLDDVIGLAEEIAAREARAGRALRIEEVAAIGAELGLDRRHVEEAVAKLAARRAAARRRRRARIGLGAGAALLLLLGGLTLRTRGRLVSLQAEAARARANVASAIDRRAAVGARYAGKPATAERDAELAGSENRVAIARRRYDEAATRYNAAARGLLAAVAVRISGLPRALPLSTEVRRW